MDRLLPISEAANVLGVSVTTLRRWEREGKLISDRTHAGHRRYDLSKIKPELSHANDSVRKTIAYARVSSHDQKTDLERQKQVLAHKDRLLRFGAELVFAICAAKNVEVVILNQGEDTTFEEDLAKDVLEIITVFSARLYGSRSRKNQKLLDGVKRAVEEAAEC
jgi:predicted site-specific integrase-resolvase